MLLEKKETAILDFYEDTGMEINIPMPDVVEELISGHYQDRRKVSVLDIQTTACTPKHLMAAAYHVAEIARSNGEHLPPDGEAHPQASGKRYVPDIVQFLIAAADTHKEHLVDRIPPMSIEAHVET